MKGFGNRLIELRKRDGLTQHELAKRIGISRSAIGNYEKEIREPDFETLEKIADYFNVELGYLFGKNKNDAEIYDNYHPELTPNEISLLKTYDSLTPEAKKEALDYITYLASKPENLNTGEISSLFVS